MIRGRSHSSSCPSRAHSAVSRPVLAAFSVVAVLALAGSPAYPGQIWTDGDADGLPDDGATLTVAPGEIVSVDIWIDSQAFQWTNFLVYAEWGAACFSYVSAQYLLTDGKNFPIDRFSHPSGVGFGGFSYDRSGVEAIGRVNLRLTAPVTCCLTPIIDPNNPYGVFSQLGQGKSYFLFSSNPGSCWEPSSELQACCMPDGSCTDLPPATCAADGGTWQGAGTTCAGVSCPPPPPPQGACCYPSGACTSFLTRDACEDGGGVYQGDGTSCATVACPQPTGACCFSSGACQDAITRDACESQGGVYQGDGTSCANVNCPAPTGACCFPTGVCNSTTRVSCESVGGVYQGDGVSCAQTNCPRACCLPNGTCIAATQSQCENSGGVYQGPISCASVSCPAASEACCFPAGDKCDDRAPADCIALGGQPQGPGTTCATANCPKPVPQGACCLLSGSVRLQRKPNAHRWAARIKATTPHATTSTAAPCCASGPTPTATACRMSVR